MDLKNAITQAKDIPVARQRLIFRGKVLKDDNSLLSYGLFVLFKRFCTIVFVSLIFVCLFVWLVGWFAWWLVGLFICFVLFVCLFVWFVCFYLLYITGSTFLTAVIIHTSCGHIHIVPTAIENEAVIHLVVRKDEPQNESKG